MADNGGQEEQGGLQGGLQKPDKHVFKAPAPRQSLLGEWGAGKGARGRAVAPGSPHRRCRRLTAAAACCLRLQAWTAWRPRNAQSRPSRARC